MTLIAQYSLLVRNIAIRLKWTAEYGMLCVSDELQISISGQDFLLTIFRNYTSKIPPCGSYSLIVVGLSF